jgi:hypothetical protein
MWSRSIGLRCARVTTRMTWPTDLQTVVELAHAAGIDDDRLDQLGYPPGLAWPGPARVRRYGSAGERPSAPGRPHRRHLPAPPTDLVAPPDMRPTPEVTGSVALKRVGGIARASMILKAHGFDVVRRSGCAKRWSTRPTHFLPERPSADFVHHRLR